MSSRAMRYLAYGLAGWVADSLFVFVHTGRRRPSHLLNVAVYGLAQPLFEPVHDRIRHRPPAVRAAVYGAGILGVEFASGRLLRRVVGYAPWNYGDARSSVDGLVRIDYLPLWGAFGLSLEFLHDALVGGVFLNRCSVLRAPWVSARDWPRGCPRSAAVPILTSCREHRLCVWRLSECCWQ